MSDEIVRLNKTELRRRIAWLMQEAKRSRGYPNNFRGEIGLRVFTFVSVNPPESCAAAYSDEPEDDLWDYCTPAEWVKHHGQTGEVVHLYLSSTDGPYRDGQLEDVVMGWVGTAEYEPIILS